MFSFYFNLFQINNVKYVGIVKSIQPLVVYIHFSDTLYVKPWLKNFAIIIGWKFFLYILQCNRDSDLPHFTWTFINNTSDSRVPEPERRIVKTVHLFDPLCAIYFGLSAQNKFQNRLSSYSLWNIELVWFLKFSFKTYLIMNNGLYEDLR